jgi:transglutaminase-like putative cysteine protease
MSTLSFSTSSPTAASEPVEYRAATRRWVDFLLLGFMLVNLALSLDAAEWSPGLDRLIIITSIAVAAGTLVAISDFGAFFAFGYAIITGAAAILYGLSDLATGVVLGQEAAYQIIERTIAWIYDAFSGHPGADSLVFVLMLAILLWILSFNATWVYFRDHSKWQAILPTGLAMLVNLYYAPRDLKAYFILYLIVAMLLLVRATLVEREEKWHEAGIHFPFDIGFDVMRDAVIFILLVVVISWVLPTAMSDDNKDLVNPLENPWKQVKEEWHQLFNTLNYGEDGATAPSVVFTPSHPLGGARSLTDAPVMDVQTSINRYYQATVLDTYISQGWELRNTVGVNLASAYDFPAPSYSARRAITQTVTMRQMTNVLMGAPMPVAVTIPADARVIPQGLTPEEALTAESIGASERALIISHAIIQPGQSYTVTSSVSFATESQLRSDSTVYAPDIVARYLQLPDTVPQRVFDLAEEIAAGYDNPYDIAKAVEAYVRGYEYNDQIPGPAPDQDAADYFLFEEKQGYCDYYATSMAVMLRHLGIPARLAQGYATGEFDPLSGNYRLLEKDAHTWVEAFFPTYGWIQFEPTASEPVIERQTDAVTPPEPGGQASATGYDKQDEEEDRNIPIPEETLPQTGFVGVSQGLWQRISANLGRIILLLALAGLVGVGLLLRRFLRTPGPGGRVRRRKSSSPDFMERLWARLLWWGGHLDVPEHASLTPLEQAEAFARTLPQTSDEVAALARLYARDQYSPRALHPDDLTEAQSAWSRLRGQFIRAWLDRRFRFRHRIRFWK